MRTAQPTRHSPAAPLIRHARPSDAEEIGETRVRAWQSAYVDFMPASFLAALDPGANLDGLRKLVSQSVPWPVVCVAEVEGIARGFSMLGAPRVARDGATHELWALNVHPEYWRCGIATGLVMRSLADARSMKAREVELWCISGNVAAETLYARCGFRSTGESRITDHLTGSPLKEGCFVVQV